MSHHKGIKKYISPRQRELTPEESQIREIAYALKTPESWAITEASEVMTPYVPRDAVLVPIPDSSGDTSANKALAKELANQTRGAFVLDILGRSEPSIPSHKLRQLGLPGHRTEDHKFEVKNHRHHLQDENVVFIDNVVTTGATFDAARNVLNTGKGIAFANAEETVKQGDLNMASKLAWRIMVSN